MQIPLSVLELASIVAGTDSIQTLQHTLEMARLADSLGYTRYWLAEHHNSPGIASAAPEIMVGQVAAVTQYIRVGSGGVMLPNHAPLKVAENFKLLEALYPGRIDLGLGRAPGTDGRTALALRRTQDPGGDHFPSELMELQAFAGDGFPAGHMFNGVRAMPYDVPLPPIWLLGSSGFSAQLAAMTGLGFSFAHHINADYAVPAMLNYRAEFRPSAAFTQPHAILAVSVVVADTDEEAAELALTVGFAFLSLQANMPGRGLLSPQQVREHPLAQQHWDLLLMIRERAIFGSPASVKARLDDLASVTQADELMIMSIMHDPLARQHSYRLLAQAYDLQPPQHG